MGPLPQQPLGTGIAKAVSVVSIAMEVSVICAKGVLRRMEAIFLPRMFYHPRQKPLPSGLKRRLLMQHPTQSSFLLANRKKTAMAWRPNAFPKACKVLGEMGICLFAGIACQSMAGWSSSNTSRTLHLLPRNAML